MLALTVRTPPDFLEAAEFDYLVSWVRSQAEQAAGDVVLVPPDAIGSRDPDLPLLVHDCRTLITARSIVRMLWSLSEGARAVAPVRLGATNLVDDRPVYTLRGYELLEERFLAGSDTATEVAEPPLPVLLLAPGSPVGDVEADVLLDELTDVLPGIAPSCAGLCHAFVDYYGQGREDILPLLPEGCRDVIEVGCGRGTTGRLIQKRLGCRVTGVELNPVVARAAAAVLHEVHTGDILELGDDLAREGPRFDALVATELFEHLTDQDAFLETARSLVRPGGRIVLSVPNVGHYSVVEDLLAGRWDYLPIGLLCFTHYRFFTRRTIEDWLARCGFRRFQVLAQRTEIPDRFASAPESWMVDRDSLSTKGFYVLIDTDDVSRGP